MERKNALQIIIFPFIVAVAVVIGMFIGKMFNTKETEQRPLVIYPRHDKLSSIIGLVSKDYVDKVDKSDIIENTIP
ncbi:MAG: hypothetical protein MI922_16570, partial [Bacteroidales bacterium]|nr:hypothetical protein [Bacteroidales bacterium]